MTSKMTHRKIPQVAKMRMEAGGKTILKVRRVVEVGLAIVLATLAVKATMMMRIPLEKTHRKLLTTAR